MLPMNRFRPNLVVTGSRPFEEDEWALVHVGGEDGQGAQPGLPLAGGVLFRGVKPCSRCKVTTTDQESGVPDPAAQPLGALKAFRSGEALGWDEACSKWRGAVFFGWNMVCEAPGEEALGRMGTVVAVGQAVRCVERRDKVEGPRG